MKLRIAFTLSLALFVLGSARAQLVDEALIKSENALQELYKLNKKSVSKSEYDIVYNRLHFYVDPDTTHMRGSVMSYFKPQMKDFHRVKFDFVNKFTIDSIVYHGQHIADYSYSSVQLAIELSDTIPVGSLDSIEVFYNGAPSLHTNRSYIREKSRPKDPHGVIFTLSEPYGAREWWPCKQSLDDKIDSLDVFVTVPKGNKAASNGLLVSTRDVGPKLVEYHWQHRYPIVTYLVAIAVTNYVEFSDWVHFKNGDSLEILNYIYPEAFASQRNRAKRTVEMMHLFDSLYGEYPFIKEKYGHAQFGFSGGMEHQTMSFMGDWNFSLIAHELAHQWFGNMVTCGSWQDLWLNESFATHLTLVAYEFLESDSSWQARIKSTADNVKSENGGSVYVYPNDTSNVNRLFSGRLTYRKGSLVLRMLRWKLGDSIFFSACRRYLNEQSSAYEFARGNDLQAAFEQESGLDLSKFFNDWIYGEGFPIYEISWGIENNLVVVNIDQSTSHNSVQFYDLPLPLYFSNGTSDTLLVVEQQGNQSQFIFKLDFKPEQLVFDPRQKLLQKHTIFHNENGNNRITIYPNPGNEVLTVLYAPHQMQEIKVYDLAGRLVLEQEIPFKSQSETELDISFLRPGCYVLQISSDGLLFSDRFIKTQD